MNAYTQTNVRIYVCVCIHIRKTRLSRRANLREGANEATHVEATFVRECLLYIGTAARENCMQSTCNIVCNRGGNWLATRANNRAALSSLSLTRRGLIHTCYRRRAVATYVGTDGDSLLPVRRSPLLVRQS